MTSFNDNSQLPTSNSQREAFEPRGLKAQGLAIGRDFQPDDSKDSRWELGVGSWELGVDLPVSI